MTIEKVYDELISMISDLQKKGGGSGGGAEIVVVEEYTSPDPGKIYLLVGSNDHVQAAYAKVNDTIYTIAGDIASGTFRILDDDFDNFVRNPVLISQDNVTTIDFTNKVIQLRSGSGTFYSWFKCPILIDKAFYEDITVEYTFQNADYQDTVDLSALEGAGDRFYVGFYYQTTSAGCRVGIAFWPELTPDFMHTYQLKSGTGASGDIKINNYVVNAI